MQAAALRAAGFDWTYELLDVEPAQFERAVACLRESDVRGGNVTVPYKVDVVPYVNRLEGKAEAVGAVNTIVHTGDELVGLNTDVDGIREALASADVNPLAEIEAVVLGAGGAARAAVVALERARVTMVARRSEAVGLGGATKVAWGSAAARDAVRRATVLVNATPLGRQGEEALEPGVLPRQAVVDLVYVRGATPLVAAARSAGLAAVDGWSVLVAQGAASFEAWTGVRAPRDAMEAAIKP
jgi:shikimate dehydrogenase